MNAGERGEHIKQVVNAIYSALMSEGMMVTRVPQSMIKVVMAGAAIDVLYPSSPVDVPSWGVGR